MSRAFKKQGIEYKLIPIQGGEHGLAGGDPKKIDAAYQQAFAFLKARLTSRN